MSDLIKLTPIFHEKIWGGRQLKTVFGYDSSAYYKPQKYSEGNHA